MNDAELLKEFAERDDQSAFRTLMERHLPLVYGTARRVLGSGVQAEDVTQTVFLLLARKARADLKVTGWLYNTTRFVAARALRAELRRTRREQEAVTMHEPDPTWQHVVPKLDDALASLNETDRSAILFRFFEQRGLREVGEELGITEEAAKKRVARAIEKLRRILNRRGIDVSAAALAAGLTYEASAIPAELATTLTATTLAKLATAEATGLLAEVLAALKWAKVKLLMGGAALVLIATLAPVVSMRLSDQQTRKVTQTFPAPNTNVPLISGNSGAGREAFEQRGLRITVLDEATGQGIAGAEVTHTLMPWGEDHSPPASIRTDNAGVAELRVPEFLPEPIPRDNFQVFVRAADYAPKSIRWLSTTGGVLRIVTNDHTVKLERGITLSGTVVEESGQPLFGVLVGTTGSDYRGTTISRDKDGNVTSPPEFRLDEVNSYSTAVTASGPTAVVTDYQGRFELPHFPSQLESLQLEFVLPEGSHRKFRTPKGSWLSTEQMPEISIQELKSGTAKFVLSRGVTVEGVVVDAKGGPVGGATITESVIIGNLRELSRDKTDRLGRFRLENRAPREVMLTAMAEGHASLTALVNIQPGMKPVRLDLPVQQPLRGTAVDEFGQPIANAKIQVIDYSNDVGLQWKGTSDAEGRYVWEGAPTNELFVTADASGFTTRYARVQSSVSNNVITLGSGVPETVRITGRVIDISSGEPVESFKVQVHSGTRATLPEYLKHTAQGRDGIFEAVVPVKVFEGGMFGAWVLQIIAEGYDPHMTAMYYVAEGDKHLDVKLDRGGTVEGVVLTPDGLAAANAVLAIAQQGESALAHRNGELSPHKIGGRSDAAGRFRLAKPLKALTLVVFHESGWGMAAIRPGRNELRLQLQQWARVEGVLMRAGKPLPKEEIALHSLAKVADHSLQVLCDTRTDNEGRFSFPRVPEGEFEVSWNPNRWRMKDIPNLYTAQQSVNVHSGEVKIITLGEEGATVTARLQLPSWLAGHSLTNVRALLWKGLPTPALPTPSQYATSASLNTAILNYHRDPAVLAAKRSQRHYLGEVAPDGTVIFPDVPPGRYTLEARLFDFGDTKRIRFNEVPVAAQVITMVSVPDGSNEIALGDFVLSAAN